MREKLHRALIVALWLPLLALTQGACADADRGVARYIAGQHYEVLSSPARTRDADKIEVMEVFWYGCSHCYHFEPLLRSWKKQQADDVVFAKTPAVWRKFMKTHAALYYAAEALQLPDAGHDALFTLLVKQPRLVDLQRFAEIFSSHGIDEAAFHKAMSAFGTASKVSQAESRSRKHYRVQGTPEIIVDGKYRVSTRMAGGQAEMLAVVDYLVDLQRRQRVHSAGNPL